MSTYLPAEYRVSIYLPAEYRVSTHLPAEYRLSTYLPAEYRLSTESIRTASVPISAPHKCRGKYPVCARGVPCEWPASAQRVMGEYP